MKRLSMWRSAWPVAAVLALLLVLAAILPAGAAGPGDVSDAAPLSMVRTASDTAEAAVVKARDIAAPPDADGRLGIAVHPIGSISNTDPYIWIWGLPWWCRLPTSVLPTPAAGVPTPVPPTPMPSPTPGGAATSATYSVCRRIQARVPAAVLQAALLEPWTIHGYGKCRNPNVPCHPMWNPLRTYLNLLNPNVPYSICNPVVWKAGCL